MRPIFPAPELTSSDMHQNREKKQTKIEQSGMTEEELIKAQEELFRSATNKFNADPQ